MTRRKKETEKEASKVVKKDIHAEAKRLRREAHEAKQAAEAKDNSREDFRKFFVKIRKKLELSQDMEEVLWIHFKRRGFAKKDKFLEGIKDFGYKL